MSETTVTATAVSDVTVSGTTSCRPNEELSDSQLFGRAIELCSLINGGVEADSTRDHVRGYLTTAGALWAHAVALKDTNRDKALAYSDAARRTCVDCDTLLLIAGHRDVNTDALAGVCMQLAKRCVNLAVAIRHRT